jgi:hypothetical protein
MARIGDKISFELQDELFGGKLRMVKAQIIRQYPKTNGLAFDCIDLDDPDIHYTIPADEKFIQIND